MKVAALFTDYDGTIAPMGVSRSESSVPPSLLTELTRLSKVMPVAVITSKDIGFVRPRTPFASAWACAMGMEVVLANDKRHVLDCTTEVDSCIRSMRKILPPQAIVERKLGSDGRVLGVCIDWSHGRPPAPNEVTALTSALSACGLHVEQQSDETFIDAYCARTDKGEALTCLKSMLGVVGSVMYLGDSVHDNRAFDLAQISVGIRHGQRTEQLRCQYLVDYGLLPNLLGLLSMHDLDFTPALVRDLTGRPIA